MNFWERIREGLSRFMYGRYGSDQLGRAVLFVSIILLFLTYATGFVPFWYLSIAGYIWAFYRVFSRNTQKRSQENQLYLSKTEKLRREVRQARVRFRNRKQYKYFRCPQCRARLRLTRGVGEKSVTCRQCGHTFNIKA